MFDVIFQDVQGSNPITFLSFKEDNFLERQVERKRESLYAYARERNQLLERNKMLNRKLSEAFSI